MRPLPLPTPTARDAYRSCISRIRSAELKQRLERLADDVTAAADAFNQAAGTAQLHTLVPAAFAPQTAQDHEELPNVYKERMARIGAPGRQIYDELKLAAQRCPLCDHRDVTTLDHHLPKSIFSLLSVAPTNLIPACSECNKIKADTTPRHAEAQTLHPYFDHIVSERWLGAEVVEGTPPALRFSVVPFTSWPSTLTGRLCHHFDLFGLAALYGAQGATLLSGITHRLRGLFAAEGEEGIRTYLQEEGISREMGLGPNHWQTAAYRALAASPWFCSAGWLTEQP
ncbi:hypothetical protein AB0M39_31210 [Streptomyces sp. NPDC051907]|uniref:hypothetical protein n=1 Tax=Streptomyces sp. NPDC051907 TaxID=3155284 RepID=UPI0034429E17